MFPAASLLLGELVDLEDEWEMIRPATAFPVRDEICLISGFSTEAGLLLQLSLFMYFLGGQDFSPPPAEDSPTNSLTAELLTDEC